MKRVFLLVALASVVASCQRRIDGAVLVKMTVAPKLTATCLRVSVYDGSKELQWTTFSRVANQNEYQVAISHSTFPSTVNIVGSAWLGNCADESSLKINSKSDPVSATFVESKVTTVEVAVGLPPSSQDADQDGYAGGTNGADCNDSDKTIFPGSVQVCQLNVDTDCDGQIGCADSDCSPSSDCANPPNALRMSGLPLSKLHHDCSPFTLELRNQFGARTATVPVTVGLSATPSAQYFTGENCSGTAVSTVTFEYLQGSKQLWVQFDAPGQVNLKATASGLTDGTAQVDVLPQPVTSLRIVGLPTTQAAGACSGDVKVELLDAQDRPTTTRTGTTLGVQVVPGDQTGNVFTTSDCSGQKQTTLPILPNESSAIVHFSGRLAGANTFTVTGQGNISASAIVTITANAATQLAFLNTPLSLKTVDACSLGTLQVQARDEFGNAAPVPADTRLQLSSTVSGVTFYPAGSNCAGPAVTTATLASGSTQIDFVLKATTVSVSGGKLSVTPTTTLATTIEQALTVTAGPPTTLVLVGDAQTTVAGECSASEISLQLQDGSHVPSTLPTPTAVTLGITAALAEFSFYTQPGCTGTATASMVTIPAGVASLRVFFKGNKIGTFSITANTTANGIANAAPLAGHSIRPGVPTQFAVTPLSNTAAAGSCSPSYTLSIYDSHLNATSFTSAQPLTFSGPAKVTFDTSPGQCMGTGLMLAAGATSATFQARGENVGAATISASAAGVSSNNVTLNVTPAAATTTVTPTTAAPIAGECTGITFDNRDMFNNAVNFTPLTMTAVPSGATVYDTLGACQAGTGANTTFTVSGASKAVWVKTTVATATPVAVSGRLTTTATANFTTSPAALSTVVTPPSASVVAGACTKLTFYYQDVFANRVGTGTVTMSGAAGISFFNDAGCNTPFSSGTVPTTGLDVYFRSTVVGTAVDISGTIASSTAHVSVTTAPATGTATVRISAGGTINQVAGNCSQVDFEYRDSFNNYVDPGATPLSFSGVPTGITLFSTSACTTGALTSFTMPSGRRSVWVRSTVVGSAVSVTGAVGASNASASVTTTPAATSKIVISQTGATSIAAGGCTGRLYLTRRDAFDNNATADGALTVTVSGSGLSVYSGASCGGSANASVSFAANSATSGDFSISGTTVQSAQNVTVTPYPPSPTLSVAITPGADHHLVFTNAPVSTTASVCSPALTVQLQDQWNNPITKASFAIGVSAPNVSFYTGSMCNTGAVSTVNLTSSSSVTFYARSSTVANPTITASGAGVTDATQTLTVNPGVATKLAWKSGNAPPASLSRFTCSGPYIVQPNDVNDLVVNAPALVPITVSGSASIAFYSNASCTTAASVSIASGTTDSTSFYAQITGGTTPVTITATDTSTSPLTAVTASVSNTGAGDIIVLSMANSDIEAGACKPLTVARQRSGGAAITNGSSTITVTSSDSSVDLFQDSACTNAGGSVTIANTMSSATLYVHGKSSPSKVSVNLNATDSSGGLANAVALPVSSYPLVRRGTCDFTASGTSCTANLNDMPSDKDISRSMLIYQASPSSSAPNQAFARCRLINSGAVPQVTCDRSATSPNSTILVTWQVASWGRDANNGGVSVTRGTYDMSGSPSTDSVTIPAVTTSRAFVLTGWTSSNNSVSTNDFFTVNLNSATSVRFTNSTNFPTVHSAYQVVEVGGGSVSANSTALSSGGLTLSASIATTRGASITPLFTTDVTSISNVCDFAANDASHFDSTTFSLGLQRGNTQTADCSTSTITSFYSLIDWPNAAVSTSATTVGGASATATWSTGTNADDRTIVFAPSQGPNGQSGGEVNETGSTRLGLSTFTLSLSSGVVTATRSVTDAASSCDGGCTVGDATIKVYAVTFSP